MGDRGYLLLELSITYVIAALMFVALVPLFARSIKANTQTEKTLAAAELAHELMAEVRLRKWDEATWLKRPGYPATTLSACGIDAGEDSADKRTFDDIDDFDNWTETRPKDPVMNDLPDLLKSFTRTVTVRYVTSAFADSGTPTNYKKVTVCVQDPPFTQTCLLWVATNF